MSAQAQITFNEILENPSDLDLNLRYAKEQEIKGKYKATIAALERLNMLYPKNTDIKLYLISILLKIDSSVRLELMMDTMLQDPNTSKEARKYIEDIQKIIQLQSKPKNPWFAYIDLGYTHTENTNVAGVTKTKRLYQTANGVTTIRDWQIDSIEYDKTYSKAASLTVGKKINSTSNISFTGGGNINTQNKGDTLENDLTSGSITYSKVIGKHYMLPYLYYSNADYRFGKDDSSSKGVGFSNSYSIDKNKSLSYGASYGVTTFNKIQKNELENPDRKNNSAYSANIGYNYIFSNINLLSSKISYYDKNAKADFNGYSGPSLNIAYTRLLPFGNFKIQKTFQHNTYDSKNAFIHPSIDRVDKTEISQVQLTGNVVQILPFLKKLDKKKQIFFSVKFSETDTDSTLLNNSAIRRNTSFNIIKRFSIK